MNCKFCNAQMEENHKFCPFCGKDQSEALPSEETAVAQETDRTATEQPAQDLPAEQVTDEDVPAEETTKTETTAEAPTEKATEKKNPWPWVLGLVGAVLGLLALGVVLLMALGVDFKAFLPKENNIMAKQTYIVSDEKSVDKAETVIATMGNEKLTNRQLQIYYRMQVMDILNYFGSYATQIGLDATKPLSEQSCYYDETMNWEQFLIEKSIETWQNYQAVALLAEEAGFEMSDEDKEILAQFPANLEEQAKNGGYDSADAMLAEVIAPGCTLDDYMEYVNLAILSQAYYISMQEDLTPTDEEISAYFDANEATFAQSGITKESGNVASVRHILLEPENGVENEETGYMTYPDEDWKKCLKEAEKLLKEWKNGDATEESFVTLVGEHTDDPGSMTTGGLYEGITPTSNFVESFRDWAVDMSRQKGDTGIVKSEFGYHIMYYVSGEPQWSQEAGVQLLSERMTEKTDAAEEKWPMSVNYKKIALAELKLS